MTGPALDGSTLDRVRAVWAELAGAAAFPDTGTAVVGNPASQICPRGWCGVVAIDGGVLATAPTAADVERLSPFLAGLGPLGDWTDHFRDAAERRGPAHLAYADRAPAERPVPFRVERLAATDHAVVAFVERVPVADREEAHVDASDGPLACVLDGGTVIAAAGYRIWRDSVAHLAVLVDHERRGEGLATAVAHAATEQACAQGLVAQWRARPAASRALARTLGYAEVGQQISLRLA